MRNLKKILALVLALVMSLSLMATAGAADFPDVKDDTSYKTAIEVLSGLGVFNGYKEDGTFRPDGEITRAETAAIIYRIVTGDVKDEQVKIYSDYGLFTDVPSTSWYAGYVNFCANAEYIKGDGKGHFNPNDKVEGYAALAMILRAIGYTANGSFTGSDWRVQTARVGESRKITKNITTGTLGSNADRKTVAEILYQAIMVDMVDHNVDNTFNGNQGYTTIPQTLGQKTFGLEQVSGVILANEWANLVSTKVLDADTTQMKVTKTYATQSKIAENTVLTLDSATEPEMQDALDAVGLTYDAHVANISGKEAHVLTLDKSDINVVAYNEGEGVYTASEHGNLNNSSWNTIEALAKTRGIVLSDTNETEYFINYATEWDDNCQSEYRISYAIAKESLNGLTSVTKGSTGDIKWSDYMNDLKAATNNGTIPAPAGNKYAGHYFGERTIKIDLDLDGNTNDANESIECYVVAIVPENTINQVDLDIMRQIFYTADRIGTNGNTAEWLQNYAVGEVYVGTTSMKDYSDTMSWPQFKAEYFTVDVNSRKFSTCEIGNSLRVIDNNDDGVAEYVLRIDYVQDKIVGSHKSQPAGYSVVIGNYEGNLLYNPQADEITQGTVVNYTEIDQKLYVWPAPVVTDSITNKNFQKITVTTASGDEYNQSGIENQTRLDENIMLMNQNTQYNMYMDVYGVNIRSYELAQGSKYALLTEMYPTKDSNASYVQNIGAIAEVKIGEADVQEYPVVLNTNGGTLNPFFSRYIWTWGARAHSGAEAWTGVIPASWLYNANYLQPAVAHLNIPAITGGNPSHVTSPAVNAGVTNNEVDNNYAPNWNANGGWWRYTAEAQVNPNWANGNGSEIGVFDYDLNAATGVDTSSYDANAAFSFTNVAAYVNNNDTLTLYTASKRATDRANGAQLYRVSEDAANAVPAFAANATAENMAMVKLWGHGTEAQLVAAYNQATGTTGGQAWFNTYTSAPYQNGKGIYPMYTTDYVQLDLTKGDRGEVLAPTDLVVKPGIRHFHINDNYSQYYNTNSNQYVDATIDTEFYIVLPGTTANTIMYRVGYADLPNIEVNKIRAAYAVATNTSADSNNRDYWVADVVVIEVTELTHDYDNIGLVYYNPFVQDGYTRYADTLNNEWRTLQPDYDGKAKMGITPKSGGFTTISWGDVSWSTNSDANYKFWKLYQTELTAPGQLAVTKASAIGEDYNTYGIYAGEVERIEALQTSGYIDVTTKNTGYVQNYAIDVDYGEAGEVPFYRISSGAAAYGTIYTASQLTLSNVYDRGQIKNGDRLIWVYNKAQNRIAFVVDLDNQTDNKYLTPAWLVNLYNDIIDDQGSGSTGAFDIVDLLNRADELDGKANPTAKELTDMIKELEAAQTKTMTPAQGQHLTTVLGNLKTTALTVFKNAAKVAAQERANEILTKSNATNDIKTAVNNKLTALNSAIDTASDNGYAALEAIYKDGKLVDTQSDVADLNAAIELANAQINAIAVATKAVTDAGLKVTDASVATEYDAFVNAIVACTKISGNAAADKTEDVEFYVKNGNLVRDDTDTTVSDLLTAIGDAADDAAEDAAEAAAEAKADSLVDDAYLTLGSVYTKLNDLKTLLDASSLSVETLNAIANGDWTVDATVYAAYSALMAELAVAEKQAAVNKVFDDAVKPNEAGVGAENAAPKPTGSSYADAYKNFGITYDGAVAQVSKSKLKEINANIAQYTPELITLVNETRLAGVTDGQTQKLYVWAGAHVDVPASANSVVGWTSSEKPFTPAELAEAVAVDIDLENDVLDRTTDLSGNFNPSGINLWIPIATVECKNTAGVYSFANLTALAGYIDYDYFQFYTGTGESGDIGNKVGSVIAIVDGLKFVD